MSFGLRVNSKKKKDFKSSVSAYRWTRFLIDCNYSNKTVDIKLTVLAHTFCQDALKNILDFY